MKKIFFIFIYLMVGFLALPVFCDEMFDEDINTEINQKYNLKAIEKDLPKLQNNYPAETIFTPTNTTPKYSKPTPTQSQLNSAIKITKGKHFKVKSLHAISDSTPRGTRIAFASIYPETFPYITIPVGTVFKGTVVNAHKANLFGNGGLVEIEINEMIYRSISYPISANITMANHKRVFFNNIKGKHQYLRNTGKLIKPGQRFMGKMWGITRNLAKDFPQLLLTPISLASGAIVYVSNTVMSPILAIFSKGGPIFVPKNSDFKIKLLDDMLVFRQ